MNASPALGDDTSPADDLRVITPDGRPLNPVPRALFIAEAGDLQIAAPTAFPAFPVRAGTVMPLRPLAILPGTTATVVALY